MEQKRQNLIERAIMLWGCVAARGTGNTALVDGRTDSSKYLQILEANVTVSEKNLKLQETGFHYRTIIQNYFKKCKLTLTGSLGLSSPLN